MSPLKTAIIFKFSVGISVLFVHFFKLNFLQKKVKSYNQVNKKTFIKYLN